MAHGQHALHILKGSRESISPDAPEAMKPTWAMEALAVQAANPVEQALPSTDGGFIPCGFDPGLLSHGETLSRHPAFSGGTGELETSLIGSGRADDELPSKKFVEPIKARDGCIQ